MSKQQRVSARRALVAGLYLVAICIIAACGKTGPAQGGLMLIVSREGSLSVDRLDIAVSENGKTLLSNRSRVPEEVTLPTTVAIVSNGDPTAQAEVSVTGWHVTSGGASVPLDRRDAIVLQIPSDRVATLSVVLSARCSDKLTVDEDGNAQSSCGEGQTCNAGGNCVSSTVVASALPTYRPGDENDAGVVDTSATGGGGASATGAGNAPGEAGSGAEAGAGGEAGGADACLYKVCNTPPDSDCLSGTQFKAYDQIGSCSAGVCSYTSNTISCACQAHSCTTDPCGTVNCDMPADPSCNDASTLTTYASSGTCSGGSCTYVSTDMPCAFGCASGTCKPDPCAAASCNGQQPDACKDVNTQTRFASSGTCSGGICSYTPTNTSCGSNMQCGGAGLCSVCKTDSSCGGSCVACTAGTPKCKDLGTTSQCVGCLADADCSGATPVCNTETNSCVSSRSCIGLATTCGSSGTADCCLAGIVPGGVFYRSYDGASFTDKSYPASVSDFRMDAYEITVGRFRKFVAAYSRSMIAAGAGKNPNNPSDPGWDAAWNESLESNAMTLTAALKCYTPQQTWTDTAVSALAESLPINCVDWYEAEAFCIWDGGRLATEAEWNYAASGGAEQRVYPWGSTTPDCTYTNDYGASGGTIPCVSPPSGAVNRVGSESPKGDGKYGQSDLAGNVVEWVQDWYLSPYSTPCNNCSYLTDSSSRAIRSGGFDVGGANNSLSSGRAGISPSFRTVDLGARCARTR